MHGEVVPWEGGPLTDRDSSQPVPAYGRSGTGTTPRGEPKVVRLRKSVLIWLICLLVVAVLAIVGLVRYLPAHKTTANAVATTSAKASPSATQPSPSQSASSSAPSTDASSTPSTGASSAAAGATDSSSPGSNASPAPTTSAVAATGGGPGAPIADLSALTPVSTSYVSNQSTGPEQIGATTYEDSVRFTCDSYGSKAGVIYNVAGYKYLTTLIGIPSDASNGAGNAMTITFYKDGSATQLSTPVTVTLDHPQNVHLNLQGSSQLEISCSAIDTTNQQSTYMDVAFGNATIGPN